MDESSATIRSNEPLNLPRNDSPLPIKTISDQIRSEEIKEFVEEKGAIIKENLSSQIPQEMLSPPK